MLALLLAPALAADPSVLFAGEVRGGLAVDGSGVATPHNGSSTYYGGPDFHLAIPPDAVVEEAWLVLVSKNGGFPSQPETRVLVNGVSLALADLVASGERYLAYALPQADFGIASAGDYAYEEAGSADEELRDGAGIGGATLAVRFSEPDGRARRRLALLAGYVSAVGGSFRADDFSASSVPAGDALLVSVGVAWECAEEQDGAVEVSGDPVGQDVGGRDDGGGAATSCTGDWNSLWTQGSFGADEAGLLVGVDGDDPDGEPAEGVPSNSRLSDELWRVPYGGESEPEVEYRSETSDSWMSVVALSLDLDHDGDGLLDEADGCTDLDGDGFGNADYNPDCTVDCDDGDTRVGAPKGYADRDGDGYGNRRDYVCVETAGFIDDDTDCDDTRADVNPAALEVCDDADTDEDCDTLRDDADPDTTAEHFWYRDEDRDGYGDPDRVRTACDIAEGEVADRTDCDDADADIFPGAPDAFFDGVDSDCNGDDAPAPEDPSDCGCTTGAPGAPFWGAILGLFWAIRRGSRPGLR